MKNKVRNNDAEGLVKYYCSRIAHMFFLIWKSYNERVELTLKTLDQMEGIVNRKEKISNDITMGMCYQIMKVIKNLSEPVTVNGNLITKNLVSEQGELIGDTKDKLTKLLEKLVLKTIQDIS